MKPIQFWILLFAALMLTACSSGTEEDKKNQGSTEVVATNQAPVAVAGIDLTVPTDSQVTLDGSGSYDADQDPLTYSWEMTKIPSGSNSVLLNADTANPNFVADKDGTYVLSLTVGDGQVASQPDLVNVIAMSDYAYPRCKDYQEPSFNIKGKTYYVNTADPGASDQNDGLSSTHSGGNQGPFKTIGRAVEVMVAGDTTYVREGTYFESDLQFNKSGSSTAPIILSAYHNSNGEYEEVIIDGTTDSGTPNGIELVGSVGNIRIQGMTIQNMQYGLVSEGGKNHNKSIVVKDMTFKRNGRIGQTNPGGGLLLASVDGFWVDSVQAYHNLGDGIKVMGSGNGMLYSQNGWVVNSSAYKNGDFSVPDESKANGITIEQGRNIAVCGTQAWHNTQHGIDLSDHSKGGLLSYNLSFENNIAFDNIYGFSVNSDSHHVLYMRNYAYGNDKGFVCFDGCGQIEFYHNVAHQNTSGGFWIEEAFALYSNPGSNKLIFNNNIVFENDLENLATPAINSVGENYDLTITSNNLVLPAGQEVDGITNVVVGVGANLYRLDELNASGLGEENLSTEPGFKTGNVGSIPDVDLVSSSTMIDRGVVVKINGKDEAYSGVAPDIGRFEK